MSKQKVALKIDGMSCGHCVKTVKEALVQSKGVEEVEVEIGLARITIDNELTNVVELTRAVDETGFNVVDASVD